MPPLICSQVCPHLAVANHISNKYLNKNLLATNVGSSLQEKIGSEYTRNRNILNLQRSSFLALFPDVTKNFQRKETLTSTKGLTLVSSHFNANIVRNNSLL